MRRVRGRRGFTMVELMVVIVIVLLLVSIFLPFLRKRREMEKLFQALSTQGSSFRPSYWGCTPRIPWLTDTKVQAAVPVSQAFFASPKTGAS